MRLEDLYQFEVAGTDDVGDPSVSLTCLRCVDFTHWFSAWPTLADIEDVAEAHLDVAHP